MRKSIVVLAVAVALCVASAVNGQGDHLHCYEIADPLGLRGVIDLQTDEFGLEEECRIGRAAYFCSPATKTVREAFDGDGDVINKVVLPAPPTTRHQICYQVSCPQVAVPELQVTDQFGTRTISNSRHGLVCTPTVKGAPDHKVAFVTSRNVTGDFGGLAGADAICAELAAEARLPGKFLAWVADSTESPDTRFIKSLTPYVRTDGVRIADDYSDLTDRRLSAPLVVDEHGRPVPGGIVWTGVKWDGTSAGGFRGNCSNWRSLGPSGVKGDPGDTTVWTQAGGLTECTLRGRLYCFEQ